MSDGFLDVSSIPDTKGQLAIEEVFGTAREKYELRNICKIYPRPNVISGHVLVGTNLKGSRKVPPLQEAPVSTRQYMKVEFECWKNVTHIAIPLEAEFGEIQDVMTDQVDDASKEMVNMENEDVADALQATLDDKYIVSGNDWGSDSNAPSVDLTKGSAKMAENSSNKYKPEAMVMCYQQYLRLAGNAEARKYISAATAFTEKPVGDRYFGLDIVVNHNIVDGTLYLLQVTAPALILVDGPERAKSWDGGPAFYQGYAAAKFVYVKRVLVDAVIKMTGLKNS